MYQMKLLFKSFAIFVALQSLTACNDFGISGFGKKSPDEKMKTIDLDPNAQDPQNVQDQEAIAVNPGFLSYQLVDFDSCATIESHLKDIALLQLELEKAWEIDHTTRLHTREDDWDDIAVLESAMDTAESAPRASNQEMRTAESSSAGGDQAGPNSHTGTNNQVVGVEEADFIKNNGTHMFQAVGNNVHISKVWPADNMAIEASIELKSEPYKLLLNENRLIVLSYPIYDQLYYGDLKEEQVSDIEIAAPDIAVEPYPSQRGPYIRYDRQRTLVTIYDISTIANPVTVHSYEVAGHVREARRAGDLIRLVSTSHGYHAIPRMTWLRYDTKRDKLISLDTKLAAIETNFAKNKAKIEEMTLSDFIRTRQLSKVVGTSAPAKISDETCKKIFSVNANVAYGLTNLVSIDSKTGALDESLLLAAVDTMYMNKQSLYLVTPYYTQRDENLSKNTSFVHKFDLKAGLEAVYQGSGEVDGTPLNQFALDEHNDILRIATTVTERTKRTDRFGFGRGKTYNIISTLNSTAEGLSVMGKTENLAETERIYSVRYQGDWAYVVTFRQVDPLFTISLKDPAAPTKVGELKIPGYSSYMQMLDENHILAVGRDGTDQGRILGMKVSVFDVTDKANPTEAATYALNDEFWSSSDAEWDHKAITFDPVTKTLALPITRRFYGPTPRPLPIEDNLMDEVIVDSFSSALYVFTIATDSITEKGVLKAKHTITGPREPWWYYQDNTVKRSVIADNFIYAISDAGIISAGLDDLASPLQVFTYPEQ